jgi:hypothetical protein
MFVCTYLDASNNFALRSAFLSTLGMRATPAATAGRHGGRSFFVVSFFVEDSEMVEDLERTMEKIKNLFFLTFLH